MWRHLKLLALVSSFGFVVATTAHSQGLPPEVLAQAEANFKSANHSGSGKLTAAEFKAFIDLNAETKIGRAARIKSNNAYSRAFSTVDANKDGFVTWQEFVQAQSR